jgi:hypothetical protein
MQVDQPDPPPAPVGQDIPVLLRDATTAEVGSRTDLCPGETEWLDFLAAADWPATQAVLVAVQGDPDDAQQPDSHSGAIPDATVDLPVVATQAGGSAIVAVIDDAIGFLNRRFRRAGAASTRFDAIWVMAKPTGPGQPNGRVLGRETIDAMIAGGDEASAYARLMVDLFPPDRARGLNRAASHGTHVADIAAGAEPGSRDGIDILGVCLPPRALRDTSGRAWAVDLVQALHWVVRRAAALSKACKAGPRPLVINLSLGMSAGPKDGTSLQERAMVEAVAAYEAATGAPARVTVAFGNDYRSRQVALVSPGVGEAPVSIGWQVQPDDRMPSRALVQAVGAITLALSPPGAAMPEPVDVPPGASVEVVHRGRIVGWVRAHPAGPGLTRRYDLVLRPTRTDRAGPVAPAGRWSIGIGRTEAAADPLVSLQVQRGDTPVGQRPFGRQSYLVHPACNGFDPEVRDWSDPGDGPITRSGTHSALATARDRRVFAVGAAGLRPGTGGTAPKPAVYSAAGSADPAWTARQGPDLTAMAEASPNRRGAFAAGTRSGGVARYAGTSVAVPELARRLSEELGPGGALAGGAHPDEIGALLALPGSVAQVDDPARQGRGWLPPTGPRRT